MTPVSIITANPHPFSSYFPTCCHLSGFSFLPLPDSCPVQPSNSDSSISLLMEAQLSHSSSGCSALLLLILPAQDTQVMPVELNAAVGAPALQLQVQFHTNWSSALTGDSWRVCPGVQHLFIRKDEYSSIHQAWNTYLFSLSADLNFGGEMRPRLYVWPPFTLSISKAQNSLSHQTWENCNCISWLGDCEEQQGISCSLFLK